MGLNDPACRQHRAPLRQKRDIAPRAVADGRRVNQPFDPCITSRADPHFATRRDGAGAGGAAQGDIAPCIQHNRAARSGIGHGRHLRSAPARVGAAHDHIAARPHPHPVRSRHTAVNDDIGVRVLRRAPVDQGRHMPGLRGAVRPEQTCDKARIRRAKPDARRVHLPVRSDNNAVGIGQNHRAADLTAHDGIQRAVDPAGPFADDIDGPDAAVGHMDIDHRPRADVQSREAVKAEPLGYGAGGNVRHVAAMGQCSAGYAVRNNILCHGQSGGHQHRAAENRAQGKPPRPCGRCGA